MGRPKGSPNKVTADIKAEIDYAFRVVNGKRGAGLIALADKRPEIFWGLVAKTIPNQVAVSVAHSFNMGDMMARAQAAIDAPDHPPAPPVIDHRPINEQHDISAPNKNDD